MDKTAHDEACAVYAALILHDSGAEISSDKMSEIVKASGNTIDAYWCPMFAGLLAKADISELILKNSAPGGGGGGGGAPPPPIATPTRSPPRRE